MVERGHDDNPEKHSPALRGAYAAGDPVRVGTGQGQATVTICSRNCPGPEQAPEWAKDGFLGSFFGWRGNGANK